MSVPISKSQACAQCRAAPAGLTPGLTADVEAAVLELEGGCWVEGALRAGMLPCRASLALWWLMSQRPMKAAALTCP